MKYQEKVLFAEFVVVILLFGFCMVPTARFNEAIITNPIHDSLKEFDPQLWEDSSIVEQTEGTTIRHIEGLSYEAQLQLSPVGNSKALAGNGADPTVYKYIWGNGGDGQVRRDGYAWDHTYVNPAMYLGDDPDWNSVDIWLSFSIGTTFASDNAKTIDSALLAIYIPYELMEGSEVTRIRCFETNVKCGYGGGSGCDGADSIAANGPWATARQTGEIDTTSMNTVGWKYFDFTSKSWLVVGDTGYLTFYILAISGWDVYPSDGINVANIESSNDPYLEITYTAWSAPTANSADITNEPSELIPGQSYTVQTIVSDTDGRSNLKYAYLYLSADHTTYRVRFDWDIDAGTFTQGEGATYAMINTTACSNTTSGATGWQITWGFNVTINWQEGYMDYANSATDAQSKTTTNWNNHNSWHTDRLWVHSITANWISEAVNLEDGDYIYTSEAINITGYVYWYSTTTVYDLGFGTPIAKLYVDGADQGSSYNCSLDASGYYNISYTTPATEDWDWSVDIQLGSLPTGMTEGPSNDNGKNPLFLIVNASAAFGETGASVSIATQPATIIPTRHSEIYMDNRLYAVGSFSQMWADDGSSSGYGWVTNPGWVCLLFESTYSQYVSYLNYDIAMGAGTGTLSDFHDGMLTQISTGWASTTDSHAITTTNFVNDRAEFQVLQSTGHWMYIDQFTLNFTSFSQNQVTDRILNGTTIIDVISLDSKMANTTFTITGIPTTYSYSHMTPGDADYTDEISSLGRLTVTNTSVGQYSVYLDTGLTWHDVAFSPTLPDGLSINWQVFEWYCNETHLNKMPYPLGDGFYYLLVKDGFDNTIVSTNFTIASTDDKDLLYGKETIGVIPLYYLEIPNADDVNYDLEFVRNDQHVWFPLSALSVTSNIRVYGIEGGADYDVYIYPSGEDSWSTKITVSMPDRAYVHDPIDLVPDEIPFEFYRFRYDDTNCYLDVRTTDGGATVYIEEDDVPVAGTDSGLTESTAFQWEKSDTVGEHFVNVTVTKTSFTTLTLNHSYVVGLESLFIRTIIPPTQTAEGNVSMTITTNWGNCTLTLDEYTWDPSTNNWQTTPKNIYTSVSEGSVSWTADFSSISVKVDVTIDGGSQSLERTFYYSKAYQNVNIGVGSPPPIVIASVVEPSAKERFIDNLPYIIIVGVLSAPALFALTKTEKIKKMRRKKKGSQDATKMTQPTPKKLTDGYTRF